MAEELVLTDPVVQPEVVTSKFRVVAVTFDREAPPMPIIGPGEPVVPPGMVFIKVRDDHDVVYSHTYTGQQAVEYIKFLNTANFSVNSMQKRILQKLTTEGILPPGTVQGTPDPPTQAEE